MNRSISAIDCFLQNPDASKLHALALANKTAGYEGATNPGSCKQVFQRFSVQFLGLGVCLKCLLYI